MDSLRVTAESPEARAIDYYALGLALSWQAEEDLAQLPESRLWLQRAINADQDLSAAYLTLGWDMARDIEPVGKSQAWLPRFSERTGRHTVSDCRSCVSTALVCWRMRASINCAVGQSKSSSED